MQQPAPPTLSEISTDSRNLIRGSKGTILLMLLFMFALAFLTSLVAATMAPGILSLNPSLLDGLLVSLLTAVTTAPFLGAWAGVAMRRARGEDIGFAMVFNYFPFATRFLSLTLLNTAILYVLGVLPFVLGEIAALIVSAFLSFVGYFIVDRDYGVLEAVKGSIELVRSNFGLVFRWLLLAIVLAVASILTLGIGLIWVVPFLVISGGMIYLRAGGSDETSGVK